MRCEVLAVGTELLLGQIVDTNSTWIGEQLAAAGIDSFEHRQVGDNQARIVAALSDMLANSDAVIVCGGLGPTPDDLTRDAIAQVMGVELVRDESLIAHITSFFASRSREMAANNLRQADLPLGAESIHNALGTAPGLLCPVDPSGNAGASKKVIYAVPGVPYEMKAMITDAVIPDLLERTGERAHIVSRTLKTWGTSESALAERIAAIVDSQSNPTIAFLARGIEGLCIRLTAKAATDATARELIETQEAALRALIGELVFGVDDESMESVVLGELAERGLTLGVAESLTGGLVGARLASVPGASKVFRGSVASYATAVKREVLGVTTDLVVSAECAEQMALGARRVLGADVGIAVTGVAGPDEQDGQPVGTVFFGIALPGKPCESVAARLPGDRERISQFATISLLDLLRRRLAAH